MSSKASRVMQAAVFLAGPVAGYQPLGFAPLLFLTTFLMLVAHWADTGRRTVPLDRAIALPAACLLGYMALTLLWTTDLTDARFKLPELAALCLCGIAMPPLAAGMTARQTRQVQQVFLYGLPIGFAICFGDMALGGPLKLMHRRWAPVNAYDREIISLGLLLFPAALIAWRRGHRAVALGGLMAYAGGILFLQSHSAMAGMVLGLAALAVALYRPVLARLGLAGIFLLGLATCIPIAFCLRHMGLDQGGLQYSFRHRVQIWNFTAERILQRPLFGYGLDGSRVIPTGDLAPGFLPLGHDHPEPHPHNIFLQIWLELGMAGVILSAAFVVQLLRRTAGLPRVSQAFMLAMGVAWLTIATFAFGIWQGWWLALLALLIALMLIAGKEDEPA